MCGVFLGKGEYSQVDAEEATDFLHPLPKGVLGSSRKKDSYWSERTPGQYVDEPIPEGSPRAGTPGPPTHLIV